MLAMLSQIALPLGLFGLLASAIPQPQSAGPNENTVQCPFNATKGPNVLIASVKYVGFSPPSCTNVTTLTFSRLPSNQTEINAWAYGYNWCSHSNKVSSGTNICSDTSTDRSVEFLHLPLTNKFGAIDWDCYANVDIKFNGCVYDEDAGTTDYSEVTATFTAKDGSSSFTYPCYDDREYHGCVYDGQLSPPSETDYTAFLSVSYETVTT
jgi:hypothetical protein